MPAKSEKQRAAMGMALKARRRKIPASRLRGAAKRIFSGKMTNKQIREFAKK